MISPEAARRSLLQMLRTRLIPLAVRQEQLPLIFMEPHSLCSHRKDIVLHRGEPLPNIRALRSPLYLHRWEQQQVHSVRFPCLSAVVEGEIDWRIGITKSVAKHSFPDEANAGLEYSDYIVVPIPEGTFFLVPPGVPYSDGTSTHWERAAPRERPATIFWMLILPTGFMCHFCRSTATKHHSHRQFFVPCPPVHHLVRMLEKEKMSEQEDPLIVRAHLQAILGYAQRSLQQHIPTRAQRSEFVLYEAIGENSGSAQDALQRARDFIETHLAEPLSSTRIGEHAYLSPRQLDRYFQRETGMNMMDYVASRRLEMAKALLMDTDLPIRKVGELVGYGHPSSFTRIFKRRMGVSPAACRQEKGHHV